MLCTFNNCSYITENEWTSCKACFPCLDVILSIASNVTRYYIIHVIFTQRHWGICYSAFTELTFSLEEMFGDFEDLETGEVHHGEIREKDDDNDDENDEEAGDDDEEKEKQEMEERIEMKKKLKTAFDAQYLFVGSA